MAEKCKNCGHSHGDHQARTNNCPVGKKSRIGYITYDPTKIFEPKTK